MARTRISTTQATDEMTTDDELAQAIAVETQARIADIAAEAQARIQAIAAEAQARTDALSQHNAADEHQMYPKSIGQRPTFNIKNNIANGDSLIFDAATSEWINAIAHLGHGWPDRVSSTMTYDPATRTLTLSQPGGITYWYKGRKVVGAEVISLQHPVEKGQYYFRFDDASGTLVLSTTGWNLDEHILTCYVYWSGTDGLAWEERHGYQRNIALHKYLHNTQGTKLISGMLMSGYTLEDGSDVSKVQWALSAGSVADEDITVAALPITSGSQYLLINRDEVNPNSWTFDRNAVVPYKYGTHIQYDNNGVLTDLADGEYVNYWVYGATKLAAPHAFTIMGQVAHPTLDHALAETLTGLDLTNLPIKECVPIYKVTFRCDHSSATPGKASIFFVDAIDASYKKAKQPVQYLDLIATKEPAAPDANHLALYAQSRGGRLLPHWVENNGLESAVQPALFGNNVVMWLSGSGSTVAIAFGATFSNQNQGGGAGSSTPSLASTNAVTQMKRSAFSTGINGSGSSGVQTLTPVAWRGDKAGLGGFFFFARFALEAYAPNERLIVGLSSLNGSLSVEPSTLLNSIALIKDSTDSTLQILCSDGTAATKVNTGITPAVDQIIDLILFCKPNDDKAYARIIDTFTGQVYVENLLLNVTLPDAATFMNIQAQIQSTSGTTPKFLSINRLYLETNT